jgi:hypothetical protein
MIDFIIHLQTLWLVLCIVFAILIVVQKTHFNIYITKNTPNDLQPNITTSSDLKTIIKTRKILMDCTGILGIISTVLFIISIK